jgi:hypothetical protein
VATRYLAAMASARRERRALGFSETWDEKQEGRDDHTDRGQYGALCQSMD